MPNETLQDRISSWWGERSKVIRPAFDSMVSAARLPGDVLTGKTPTQQISPSGDVETNSEVLKRSAELAALTGSGNVTRLLTTRSAILARPKQKTIRLFHGTTRANENFNDQTPVFMTDSLEGARSYALEQAKGSAKNRAVKVVDLDRRSIASMDDVMIAAEKTGAYTDDEIGSLLTANFLDPAVNPNAKLVIENLREAGFEGAVFSDFDMMDRVIDTWVVFNPSRLKVRGTISAE